MTMKEYNSRALANIQSAFPACLRILLAFSLLFPAPVYFPLSFAHAAPPQIINFQGRLTDVNNNPENGPFDMAFAVYDAAGGGNQLWTEDQTAGNGHAVSVSNGVFSVQLGSVQPIPQTVFNNAETYLEVKVGAETLSPRQRLVSAPYALNSARLEGRTADSFGWSRSGTHVTLINLGDRVGIGTTGPGRLLSIRGLSPSAELINSDSSDKSWRFEIGGNDLSVVETGVSNVMTFKAGGNVGIGTTGPGQTLDVNGAIRSRNGQFELNDGATTGGGLYFHKTITGAGTSLEPVLFAEGATGKIYFMTGGSVPAKMVIDQSGNVGIGTTSTNARLHAMGEIRSENTANPFVRLIQTGNGNDTFMGLADSNGEWPALTLTLANGNNVAAQDYVFASGKLDGRIVFAGRATGESIYTPRFVFQANGNVGIGTTGPGALLHVKGGDVYIERSGANALLSLQSAGGAGRNWNLQSKTDGSFSVGSDLTADQFIVKAGNVGIGTINPQRPLQIDGVYQARFNRTVTGGNQGWASIIELAQNDTPWTRMGLLGNRSSGVDTMARFWISTNKDSAAPWDDGHFVIQSGGNVGIGTTGPEKSLHVNNNAAGLSYALKLSNNQADVVNYGTGILFHTGTGLGEGRGKGGLVYVYDGAATWNKGDFHFLQNTANSPVAASLSDAVMTIKNNGNVGIGTTDPQAFKLAVNGSAANTTGTWALLSDARLKRDIAPIRNALDAISRLKGVTFRWRDAKKDAVEGLQRGFIAQEVEPVIPEWVKTGADGYKMLQKVGVEAMLVEAIKELKAENDRLKEEVNALKDQISKIAQQWEKSQ